MTPPGNTARTGKGVHSNITSTGLRMVGTTSARLHHHRLLRARPRAQRNGVTHGHVHTQMVRALSAAAPCSVAPVAKCPLGRPWARSGTRSAARQVEKNKERGGCFRGFSGSGDRRRGQPVTAAVHRPLEWLVETATDVRRNAPPAALRLPCSLHLCIGAVVHLRKLSKRTAEQSGTQEEAPWQTHNDADHSRALGKRKQRDCQMLKHV